jgi:hypothetical protein
MLIHARTVGRHSTITPEPKRMPYGRSVVVPSFDPSTGQIPLIEAAVMNDHRSMALALGFLDRYCSSLL